MSKIVTYRELADLVHALLVDPEALGALDERAAYESFVGALAQVVADHCGGEIGTIGWIEAEEADGSGDFGLTVAVRGNESLPSDGGVWKFFDPEGDLDGVELPEVFPAWPARLLPKVLVTLKGGLVDEVYADRPALAHVLDFDLEGADEASIVDLPDWGEVCPSKRAVVVNPDRVAEAISVLEAN